MIRYWASTDDSPIGRLALECLKTMLKIRQVRVLSLSSGMHGRWENYSSLLMTHISTPYVNVVCCEPAMWVRTHSIKAPLKMGGFEIITGTTALYTEGVRNVLIAGDPPSDPAQLETAMRYQAIVTPAVTAGAWLGAAWIHRDLSPTVVTVDDMEALRAILQS